MSANRWLALERLPRVMAACVAGIAVAALVGWATNISSLKSFYPSRVEMKIVTAVTFLFAAVALTLTGDSDRSRRRVARAAAGVVVVLGGVSMAQYVFGVDLLVDRMFVAERPGAVETIDPGRMAPQTTVLFVLLGVAMLVGSPSRRVARLAQEVAIGAAMLLALVSILGYLYEIRILRTWQVSTPVAFSTALAFGFLSLGVAATRPDAAAVALLTSEGAGGAVARRLIPGVIVLTTVAGWLRVIGQRLGWYNTETGVALFAATTCMAVTALVWWIASRLEVSDARRRRAEESLRMLAVTDDVTGALNRRGFLELASRELASATGRTATLTVIDIDSLGLINDTFGAARGDAALAEVAELAARASRHSDVIGRIAGDRFATFSTEDAVIAPFEAQLPRAVDRRNEKTSAPFFLHVTTASVQQTVTSSTTIDGLLEMAQARLTEERRRRRRIGYEAEAV